MTKPLPHQSGFILHPPPPEWRALVAKLRAKNPSHQAPPDNPEEVARKLELARQLAAGTIGPEAQHPDPSAATDTDGDPCPFP